MNKGNCCFWYSLILLFYQDNEFYEKLKDTRGKLIETLANKMCAIVGFAYNNKVAFRDIPTIKRSSVNEILTLKTKILNTS